MGHRQRRSRHSLRDLLNRLRQFFMPWVEPTEPEPEDPKPEEPEDARTALP